MAPSILADDAPPREAQGDALAAPEAPARPAFPRRAAEGAWHVLAGFLFLARRPRLWPLAILPVLLLAVLLAAGFFAGVLACPWIESVVVPGPDKVSDQLGFLMTLTLWIGTVTAAMALGLGLALFLSAPVLERLSRQVERLVRGRVDDLAGGLRWEIAQSLRSALYFLAAAPGVFLLDLIPLVGPLLGGLWGAHVLAFQQTDAPLARRGLDFQARRAWHRRWRAESLGFGLAGLLLLIVPVANVLLAPVLAVGATLLVLELEDELAP